MSLVRNKSDFKASLIYFAISLFSLLLMAIYYAVDHGLRDMRMTLLFLPPLVAAIFFFTLNLLKKSENSDWKLFFHMGFASFYLYLLCSSIISMASCVNEHLIFFLIIGGVLFIVSFIFFVYGEIKRKQSNR